MPWYFKRESPFGWKLPGKMHWKDALPEGYHTGTLPAPRLLLLISLLVAEATFSCLCLGIFFFWNSNFKISGWQRNPDILANYTNFTFAIAFQNYWHSGNDRPKGFEPSDTLMDPSIRESTTSTVCHIIVSIGNLLQQYDFQTKGLIAKKQKNEM